MADPVYGLVYLVARRNELRDSSSFNLQDIIASTISVDITNFMKIEIIAKVWA